MVVEVKPQRPEEYSESDVKKLLNRYNHAKAIKDLWLPTFEECYEYALPQRESFYTESIGRRRSDRIFDETAVVGVQEFASRLQAGIVPTFARWADFQAGVEIPEEQKPQVNLELDQKGNIYSTIGGYYLKSNNLELSMDYHLMYLKEAKKYDNQLLLSRAYYKIAEIENLHNILKLIFL